MSQRNGEFSWTNILSQYPTAASIKKQVKNLITTKAEARIQFGPTDMDILAARTPPMYRQRPELWFSQVEAQLQLCYGAASEDAMFNFVVALLDVETAGFAEAIIIKPPQENKYGMLKARLIGVMKQKLLDSLPPLITNGKKPSDMLHELRQLCGEGVPEGVLQEHWFKQLPRPVQDIVMTDADLPLEAVVEIANKVYEVMFLQPTPPPKFQPDDEVKVEQEVKPKVELNVEPKIKPPAESKVEPKAGPKLESKVELKVRLQVEPKVTFCMDPKMEPKVEAKGGSKVELKEKLQPSHHAEVRRLHMKVEVIEQQMAELQKKETVREEKKKEKKEEDKVICWYHKTHKVWANKCDPPCNFHQEYIEPLNRARMMRANPQQPISHNPKPAENFQNTNPKICQTLCWPNAQNPKPVQNSFIESITRNLQNPPAEIAQPPPYWSVAQNPQNYHYSQSPLQRSQNFAQHDAVNQFWGRIYVENLSNVAGCNMNSADNILSRMPPPAYY